MNKPQRKKLVVHFPNGTICEAGVICTEDISVLQLCQLVDEYSDGSREVVNITYRFMQREARTGDLKPYRGAVDLYASEIEKLIQIAKEQGWWDICNNPSEENINWMIKHEGLKSHEAYHKAKPFYVRLHGPSNPEIGLQKRISELCSHARTFKAQKDTENSR